MPAALFLGIRNFAGFHVPSINMTVDYVRSPYLVRPVGKLDEVYHDWVDRLPRYDTVALNAGHWLGKLNYSSQEGGRGCGTLHLFTSADQVEFDPGYH